MKVHDIPVFGPTTRGWLLPTFITMSSHPTASSAPNKRRCDKLSVRFRNRGSRQGAYVTGYHAPSPHRTERFTLVLTPVVHFQTNIQTLPTTPHPCALPASAHRKRPCQCHLYVSSPLPCPLQCSSPAKTNQKRAMKKASRKLCIRGGEA